MTLDSVLSSMHGDQPPQMRVANNLFLQNQPGGAPPRNEVPPRNDAPQQAAELQPAQPRSILNSWVHSGVGLLGFSESNTRNEVEGYISEGLTAAPLFMGGKRGVALSALMSGLNEAKQGETGWHLASDLSLGAAKGAGTKLAFDLIGARNDMNFAAKGMTMGATARGINVGLSRNTWFDQNDHFQPGTGFGTTAVSMFHPYSLATDVLSFGIAHGTIKGLSGVSERFATRLETSPVLQNTITAGTFGFTSGSLGEVQRQMTDPNAHFDPLQIALRGGASAATMTLAGAGGSYFSAPGQFVVRPQTESFNPMGKIQTSYNQFRSWLGRGSAAGGQPTPIDTSTTHAADTRLATATTDVTSPLVTVEPTIQRVATGIPETTTHIVEPTVQRVATDVADTTTPLADPTVHRIATEVADTSTPIADPTVHRITTDVTDTTTHIADPSVHIDTTTPVIAVEPNASNPQITERTLVRIQQPNSETNQVVTNPGELNLARFTPKNYDVWDTDAGFHFFRDDGRGIERAFTSIGDKLRFELHDDGVWRTRRVKTNDPLLEPTPAQRAILERALAMEKTALAAERTHNGTGSESDANVSGTAPVDTSIEPVRSEAGPEQPQAPRVVKGIDEVNRAIDGLPEDLADVAEQMREFLNVKPSSKKFAKRVKQMEEVLSLTPEMREQSAINDIFRRGLLGDYPELLESGLETARNKMSDALEREAIARQDNQLLEKQEQLAQAFMDEHPNQPKGDTLEEFLRNPHLEERLDPHERIDLALAARLVAENSGPGQPLEVLKGNVPLAAIASGGESVVLLMDHPIGDTGHRLLKITFTEWQPEYGKRYFDADRRLLTPDSLGETGGRAMFYTQEFLDTANIDPQQLSQFESKLANSGYTWDDRDVEHARQVGVNSKGQLVLADYGAVSIQRAAHY
ncbi:MAG TPA: hypothetical protein V6C69_11825 [Trichormus sp.]